MPTVNLKVGPQSAGANPGPICYGKGGTEPTVTDAAVALGRLPAALVGGEIGSTSAAARRAFVAMGERLGLDPDELAAGALEIAAANQVFGIRQVTTVARPRPGRLCDGRLRWRRRILRHRSRRLSRHRHGHIAAQPRQSVRLRPACLRCHAATISARWCAGSPRPTQRRFWTPGASWSDSGSPTSRPKEFHRTRSRSTSSPTCAISAKAMKSMSRFREARRRSPRFHVEGIPQGA